MEYYEWLKEFKEEFIKTTGLKEYEGKMYWLKQLFNRNYTAKEAVEFLVEHYKLK